MNNNDIPVWEKYTLTIEEASKYFRIGENKLRRLAEENKDAGWLIMNGNRIQIKRRQFEKIIDKLDAMLKHFYTFSLYKRIAFSVFLFPFFEYNISQLLPMYTFFAKFYCVH